MKKNSLLELYYNLSSYEPMTGGGYNITNTVSNNVLGKQTAGKEKIISIKNNETSKKDNLDLDDEEDIDGIAGLNNKIGLTKSVYKSDQGNRTDKATLTNNNHMSIFEYAGDHQNFAMKGLSPRLTYRSKTNTKGPAFGTQSSATYIRNAPGRISGTQYGTSRANILDDDGIDNKIFNLNDLNDPMERSFKKQQNKINKVLMSINEYLILGINLKPLR